MAARRPLPSPHRSEINLGAAALKWIEVDRRPRMLLSDRLDFLWGNSAAISALAAKDDLELRGGRLSMRVETESEALARFIHASGEHIGSILFPRPDTDGHALIVTSRRLELAGARAFAISFFTTERDERATYADLRAGFGLTRAEQQVVAGLLAGNDPQSLAAEQRVAVSTVRSHLKSVYTKLKVRSREGLFAKLSRLRID